MDEEAAAVKLLLHRVIHRHRRLRHQVLVVHVGDDADDAPGPGADVDELHHRVGPHQPPVHGVHAREHALGDALADDHDLLAVAAIALVEVASGDDRHAERLEESRRDGPEPRPRILFAVGLLIALGRELRGEESGIPPRHDRAERDALDAGQLRDSANRFLVEAADLLRLTRVGDDRDVHRQHVAPEPGLLPLQREERRDQHARARDQHERGGDLRHGEHAQAAVRAGREPDAAAGQPRPVGRRPPTAAAERTPAAPPRQPRGRRRPRASSRPR